MVTCNPIEYSESNHSPQIGELMAALAKAQGEITGALKSSKNPFFKSNYASLPDVWDVIRKPLSTHAISIVQTIEGTADQMYLMTILGHSSGQYIKSKIPLILSKKTPQEMGSCITYARRYSLMAMVGVCAIDEDDDGEAATKPHRKEVKPKEVAHEPDLTQDEIDGYIDANFPNHKPQFIKYMVGAMKTYNWNTFREAIDQFVIHKDAMRSDFGKWLKANPNA